MNSVLLGIEWSGNRQLVHWTQTSEDQKVIYL